MFRIEPTPTKRPLGRASKWVVDHERDVSIERIIGTGEDEDVMQPVWRGRIIPFQIAIRAVREELTGESYFLTRFVAFGYAFAGSEYGDVEFYRFKNDEEKREAQLLAVEALTVFGSIYDGDDRPEGYYRVEFEGKTYVSR